MSNIYMDNKREYVINYIKECNDDIYLQTHFNTNILRVRKKDNIIVFA